MSGWTKVDRLTEVVAERRDLIEDYLHIQALGEALTEGKVKEISLADTKFTSATLTAFVQSVRWETAALTEVDVRRNMLYEAVLEQLRAAAPETCKILAD